LQRDRAALAAAAPPSYASDAERMEAFLALLSSQSVPGSATFASCQRQCEHDVRWGALRRKGERRQAVSEYLTRTARREKEEAREREARAAREFGELLAETAGVRPGDKLGAFAAELGRDARWEAVREGERERLFDAHAAALSGRAEREREAELAEKRRRFRRYLGSVLEMGEGSTWDACR
jgi:hypothetical protein